MTAFLGGYQIERVGMVGLTAVAVTITTDYTDMYLQLYAGRRLIGVSRSAGVHRVVGQLVPAKCPHALTVVMVSAADLLTDFGSQLPKRPLNQFQLAWAAASFPSDAKWFEITACIAADGAVDPDNVVARVAYRGDGSYEFILDPINAPGTWSNKITPRDDAMPRGNAGPAAEVALAAVPYPPDVAVDDDGNRLLCAVNAGELTVSFAYDW